MQESSSSLKSITIFKIYIILYLDGFLHYLQWYLENNLYNNNERSKYV